MFQERGIMFSDFWISWFEVTLVGYFFSFMTFLSWVHDGFMCIVHELLHAMFERNKNRSCWRIYIATEAHYEILKTIVSLDSDVHDYTNPVMYWSSMWFLNLFQVYFQSIYPLEMVIAGILLRLFFCSPISMNNFYHDVICMVNTDSIFTLNNVNVEEF